MKVILTLLQHIMFISESIYSVLSSSFNKFTEDAKQIYYVHANNYLKKLAPNLTSLVPILVCVLRYEMELAL